MLRGWSSRPEEVTENETLQAVRRVGAPTTCPRGRLVGHLSKRPWANTSRPWYLSRAETNIIPCDERPSNALSEIAPTLLDLKKLPLDQKMRLLLARLKKIGRNESSLNKHNLSLPGDPYGLVYGYPDEEKKAVMEHLLGTPWIKLVNEGYLVDLSGQGFHRVSEEGEEFLKQEPQSTPVPAPIPESTLFGAAIDGVPRAFISYSWEGPEHQEWVFRLATRLQGTESRLSSTDGICIRGKKSNILWNRLLRRVILLSSFAPKTTQRAPPTAKVESDTSR